MRVRDVRFAQVLNLIRRYESVMVMVNREGMDIKLAREYLNESRYALKLKKYEESVEYAKKCGEELVKLKREKESHDFFTPENITRASKEELRDKCQNYGLNPIGLKSTLEKRLMEYYNTTIKPQLDRKDSESPIADRKLAREQMSPGVTPQVRADPGPPPDTYASPDTPTSSATDAPGKDTPPAPPPEDEKAAEPERTNDEEVAKGLHRGSSYIMGEDRPYHCFKVFCNIVKEREFIGLCLTRSNPSKIRSQYDIGDTSILWLTDSESSKESTVPPSLESIMYIIEEFLDREENTVLLIDGMEYLVSNNQFNPVLRFLRRLIDKISESEAILIISISPDTLDEKELKLLERELEPIRF